MKSEAPVKSSDSSGFGVAVVLGIISATFVLIVVGIVIGARIDESSAAFLAYATIRTPTVPALVVLTAILCVVLPYSWRGLPRATYKCPSFLMAVAFLFVGTPLHFVMGTFLPDGMRVGALQPDAYLEAAAQKFFSDVKRASVLFFVAHGVLTLIRLKYTLTKWQALIFCEVAKAMYAVFLLWGFAITESELSNRAPVLGCMMAFVTILLAPSCVRAIYAFRCQFDGERFNHTYFGSDSKCPMKRVHLMCMVCEKKRAEPTTRWSEKLKSKSRLAAALMVRLQRLRYGTPPTPSVATDKAPPPPELQKMMPSAATLPEPRD